MKLEAWAVGITAGSREVPGRKGLWQETSISYNNNVTKSTPIWMPNLYVWMLSPIQYNAHMFCPRQHKSGVKLQNHPTLHFPVNQEVSSVTSNRMCWISHSKYHSALSEGRIFRAFSSVLNIRSGHAHLVFASQLTSSTLWYFTLSQWRC